MRGLMMDKPLLISSLIQQVFFSVQSSYCSRG